VVPNLLHIIPIGDDTVLDRVLQRKNTSLRLGLISVVSRSKYGIRYIDNH
jgi:hypothetical protein